MSRYNLTELQTGEYESEVPGWILTYPATCNGHLGDLAFACPTGYGNSGFVHFDADGQPYGMGLTKAARARLVAMRRDLRQVVSA